MLQSPLFALGFWLVLLPALWASGSLAGFRLRSSNPLFLGILTLGLGLGVYAYFFVLAGSLGWLKPVVVLAFLVLFLIPGWRTGLGVFRWLKEMLLFLGEPRGVFSRVCQFSLLGTLFLTALFCFLPEISNDSLGIHLYLAKLFVKNASVAPSLYDLTSYRPLLMTVLYATGLFFQNVAIAKLFHWFCGVLLILALSIKVDEVTKNRKLALFMGLMLWLTPTLMNQITTTYIDAGVSLFIFLGYCVVIDGFDELKKANFFYGGLLIGLAVAIRSLALGAFLALMVMLGLRLLQRGSRKRVMIAGVCLAFGVLLTSGYWFLRDWIYTGNPVYPYLGSLFGNEELSYLTRLYFQVMGPPKSLGAFLMIPWNITFKPEDFDYHHWIGPFYLSVLPAAGYAAFKIKKARTHLLFIFLSMIIWYFTGQEIRYLLPVFPVYLIVVAMGVSDLANVFSEMRRGTYLAKVASCLAIISLLSLTAYHYRYQFLPVFRIWSSGEYLRKTERTIPVADWVNENLPPNARILSLVEPHLFYFDREVILDVEFHIRTHYKDQSSSAAIAAILKEKGITHILDADIQDPTLSDVPMHRPIELVLKDTRFSRSLASLQSVNVLGRRSRYILYKLL